MKGKPSSSFVRLFSVIRQVGLVAYRLQLPEEMNKVHGVFHVSNLHKWFVDETYVMSLKDVEVNENLKFVEEPLQIEDRIVKKVRRNKLTLVKVK